MLVTLYPTQSTLGDQKLEQRSWRRFEAFPHHLCPTTAQLCGFCGSLPRALPAGATGLSLALKNSPQP